MPAKNRKNVGNVQKVSSSGVVKIVISVNHLGYRNNRCLEVAWERVSGDESRGNLAMKKVSIGREKSSKVFDRSKDLVTNDNSMLERAVLTEVAFLLGLLL